MDIGKLAGVRRSDWGRVGSRSVRTLHHMPKHLDLKAVATPLGFSTRLRP